MRLQQNEIATNRSVRIHKDMDIRMALGKIFGF